jgi:hypothetical protein
MDNYTVLLAKPEIGDLNVLAGVFETVRGVTRNDGMLLARQCWGFLAENVSIEEADKVVKICRDSGIEVLVVPAEKISAVPKYETFTKADCRLDGLIYTLEPKEGALRQDIVLWDKVLVASAAPVKEQKITVKVTKEGPSMVARAASMGVMMTTGVPLKIGKTKEVKKESVEFEIIFYLELYFDAPPFRVRMRSDKFDFSYLGARKGYATLVNFGLLLADIDSLAPKAVKNRGFKGILKKETLSFMGYDSVDYFDKECRWLITLAKK